VHQVGSVSRMYSTMHGSENVKLLAINFMLVVPCILIISYRYITNEMQLLFSWFIITLHVSDTVRVHLQE